MLIYSKKRRYFGDFLFGTQNRISFFAHPVHHGAGTFDVMENVFDTFSEGFTLNIEMMKKKMAESIADLLPREKEIITKFYGIGIG